MTVEATAGGRPSDAWAGFRDRARQRLERRRRAARKLVELGRISPETAERRIRINEAVVAAIEELP